MYEKNKSKRITLRLSEELFDYLSFSADSMGISPSDFLRMVITFAMNSNTSAAGTVPDVPESCQWASAMGKERSLRRENEKAYINDKL